MNAALRSFEAQYRTRPADALGPWRDRAMQRFVELGLPGARDESWRYTNLRPLQARQFAAAPDIAPDSGSDWLSDAGRIPTLTLVNGVPRTPLAHLPAGVRIRSLHELASDDPQRLAPHLALPLDTDLRRWELLNTALFRDGVHIEIGAPAQVALCLVHVTGAAGSANAAHPRIIVELAPGARATLIEQYRDAGTEPSLCNSCTQVQLGGGARLEHYRVFAASAAATQFDSLQLTQQQDSEARLFTIALGTSLLRTSLDAQLGGSAARLESRALLVGHGERLVDSAAVVTHAARSTVSRQTARCIASGTSRVITNSKVVVAAGATGADSQQSLRGMLLAPGAEIDSRPQLEIHADEVKCAHGATTGRLDSEMFFYLLSRGIERATAQSLLVFAFLGDVLTGMSQAPARAAIENALVAQLPDADRLKDFR